MQSVYVQQLYPHTNDLFVSGRANKKQQIIYYSITIGHPAKTFFK